MPKAIDLTGRKFGRLTVLCASRNKQNKRKYWECVCDCGTHCFAYTHALIRGSVKSCGCSKVQHGGCTGVEERLYGVWRGMRQRCYDKNRQNYKNYGGRGITVCDEWRDDYGAFRSWAYQNGYDETMGRSCCLIDRIDNSKGYSPDNCRFVTPKDSIKNRRNTVTATLNGETHTIKEWCDILNKDYNLVRGRMYRGWNFENAIDLPIQYQNRRRNNG